MWGVPCGCAEGEVVHAQAYETQVTEPFEVWEENASEMASPLTNIKFPYAAQQRFLHFY